MLFFIWFFIWFLGFFIWFFTLFHWFSYRYILYYQKSGAEVKLEVCLSIPVGAEFILNCLNPTAVAVDESKYRHSFGYNSVAVIVDIGLLP